MRTILLFVIAGGAALGCSPPPQNTPTYWAGNTRAPMTPPPADGTGGSAGSGGGSGGSTTLPPPDETPPPIGMDARAPTQPPRDAGTSVDMGTSPVVRDTAPPPVTVGDGGMTGTLPGASCSIRVAGLSKTQNRGYAPRNVGALWIADSTGKFVKSLNVWGNRRLEHLERWVAATRTAGSANNKIDAVSAATMSSHAMRTGMWNCTNFNKVVVPDGEYQACYELNESNSSASQVDCVKFTKTTAMTKLNPPDVNIFSMRVLEPLNL